MASIILCPNDAAGVLYNRMFYDALELPGEDEQ